jgi:hypothetical protein
VSEAAPLLDRRAIEGAFRRLGARLAARRRDGDDIRFLVRRLGLTSVEQVLAVCAEVFPDEPVPDRARLVLEDTVQGGDQGQDS